MENLLTVKEAAKLLHVSEMTIRRWTNAGHLSCYRIGPKRERRFSPENLKRCMESGKEKLKPVVSLGYKDMTVAGSAHVTHLSLGADESLEIGVSYIAEGLRRGESVMFVCSAANKNATLQKLDQRGMDSSAFIRPGRLRVSSGTQNPSAQIETLMRASAEAKNGFRIFGDMTWTQNKGWSAADLRELEERAGEIAVHARHLLLCQYPLESFSAPAAMMAMETHDVVLYRDKLVASPYA